MSSEQRKRSRFDQTEPSSSSTRFDRRSRSPSNRSNENRRSRSPIDHVAQSPDGSEVKDNKAAASAAAAAAAKINAQIQAKKATGESTPSTVKTVATPGSVKSPSAKNDIYQQDGDYIKDIEINDLRNRYTLTKGSTQKMIKDDTGADVTTRGNYYPDKSMATAASPPLYLHVTSTSREGLEQAIEKVNEMMKQDLPNLVDERRFRRPPPRDEVERDEYGRRKWPEEKIPIDLEPIPGFNLRAQVVGQGGVYVKHIQSETGCRVQIKGRGSGFHERDTNAESDEPMYLHVSAPQPDQVSKGKDMCTDLLGSVKERYEDFKHRGPANRGPPGGRGGHHYIQDHHDDLADQQQQHDPQTFGAYSAMSSGGNGGDPATNRYDQTSQSQPDQYALMNQWVEYYNARPDEDPYKEYGGYAAYLQTYFQGAYGQHAQQGADQRQNSQYDYPYQQQGQDAASAAAGGDVYSQEAPPPPPPDNSAPPPPPPPGL
ncbi:MAG: hypothetical protein Q9162_006487 [Coniocarpon cinnabarinum]